MRVLPVSDRIKEAPAQALRGVFAGIGQLLLITDKLRNKTPAEQHVPQARVPEPTESAAEAHDVTVVREQEAAPEAAEAGVTVGVAKADVTVEADVTEVPPVSQPAEQKTAQEETAREKTAREKTAREKTAAEETAGDKTAGDKTAGQRATHQEKATREKTAAPTAAEPKAAGLKAPELRTPQAPTAKATEIRDFDKSGNVRLLPDTGAAAKAGAVEAGAVEAGAVEAPLPNYGELSIASLRARLRNLDIGQVRQLAEYEKGHAGRADVIAMFERRIAKLEAGE